MPKGEKSTAKNAEVITSYSKQYSAEVAGLRALVDERKARRKYKQEDVGRAFNALQEYADECFQKKQPLTVAGMQLAIGMLRDAWYRAKDGELDYLLEEYIIDHHITEDQITIDQDGLPWFNGDQGAVLLLPWSELRKKADLLIQDQLERNCYTNRGNPAGSIFGLKAQFNWREDEGPQHLVQQLVIADLDQAKKALEMLK